MILKTANLSVSYGKVEALHAANIRIKAGEIVTVIGPNGAGKSSLLNAIMGILPGNGMAIGGVEFLQGDIAHVAIEERVGLGLCLVPEKRELFTSMSVEDNLQLGAYKRKKSGDKNYMDQLGPVYDLFPRLRERRRQIAGTLSGGERQMLALGRALMSRPRLLMLDEPSLGLAPLITKQIFHIISELRNIGVATLLVEQNARAALQVADYAYVLELGVITMEGAASNLINDQKIIASYLGLSRQ